jgi:hypothetical protein
MYLGAGARPCFKTLCNFRNLNASAIRRLMAEVIGVCRAMGLSIVGRLVLDSTRIKANSGRDNLIRARDYDEALKAIGEMLGDSRGKDDEEDSLYGESENGYLLPESVKKSIKNLQALQAAIRQARREGRKAVSPTDPECREMRESNTGRIVPGYSMQVAVDKASGLITVCDVVNEQTDHGYAPEAARQHEQNTGEKVQTLDADSGYFSAETLKELHEQGVDACIPDQRTARELKRDKQDEAAKPREEPKTTINDFQPVEGEDAWKCPAGRTLKRASGCARDGRTCRTYRAQASCRDCPLSGRCLRESDEGFRHIEVDENHLLIRENRARFQDKAHKARYRERGGWIERIFGHARRNVGLVQWLHNGLQKVKPTAIFFAIAHNMRLLGRHMERSRQNRMEIALCPATNG